MTKNLISTEYGKVCGKCGKKKQVDNSIDKIKEIIQTYTGSYGKGWNLGDITEGRDVENRVETVDKPVEKSVESVKKSVKRKQK